ncbi:pentatricopeptide repeat-containing protein At1g77170, mitochondrial-like [Impatiens glandulifera]|uniref:pentatricopeptide repeat-containing protein At1g77170, mitochondrial-like n=1 Tax=Impatiens glandulifera TaxID=253017 RepID=UPI001FB156B8|nr:pentatricopeptide repeat-containing protein At1g77170, mitochondrial-like [Impatiens glandulifera]
MMAAAACCRRQGFIRWFSIRQLKLPSFNLFHSQTQDPVEFLHTRLSTSSNLKELNQIYAQIIRTHFLESHSAPFYWNSIIRQYSRLDEPAKALYVFLSMARAFVNPDSYTLPIVLKSVCQSFNSNFGHQVHCVSMKHGLHLDEFIESALISFYCKSGTFENARKVFDENPERKLGSWNAIISGLSQAGCAKEVITMFLELMRTGLRPDDVTMVCVTSSCGSLGDLNLSLQLHKCIYQAKTFERSDLLMLNSLIDMYGKCGRMDLANRVFSRMEERNVSSWTSMIVGYGMHGHVNEALDCFSLMREARVRPNYITFVGVLSACVHGGRVGEGKRYFEMMKNEYGIEPRLQHYGCMVDLIGRAGLFEEAKEMVLNMPMESNVVVWGSLMGACEKYGNVEMGEFVAKRLIELEPWNEGVYVVLSNIYANHGLWEDVERMRGFMKDRRLDKIPAYSYSGS